MSIANSVRAALRNASGPLKASEIRELCDDDYTPLQISGALTQLETNGEVQADRGERPFTFIRTKSLVLVGTKPVQNEKPSPAASTAAKPSAPAAAPAAQAPVSASPAATLGTEQLSARVASLTDPEIERLIARIIEGAFERDRTARPAFPAATSVNTAEGPVARRAAGLMIAHWPNAELPPPIREFVLDALGGAA